ncbi:hypothetical protein [Pseudoalteromonas agarivorans]|uniref:Uncharacterized protein n=1 Tax=Pseudoalteromonas agarivorans TaxID=176102 RepID=A0AAD0U1J1_9GAMM|nr:hypothetical protein [Pseudoalteromonas agarivorans]AYM87017.1 hypothetical protein D9T18_10050 [Pseudoalteromonas agarivorans]
MYEDLKLPYNEVDFIVPIHRFNFQYSYVTKERLSFVREFILRIVQLAPLKPHQIATYIGLDTSELKEALSDLIEKGELQISDSGDVILTPKSEGYFEGLGKLPKSSSIMETSSTLSFEIGGFNCLGTKRIKDNWKFGVALDVENEVIANSESYAKSKFQRDFYYYYDKEWLKGVKSEGTEKPSIYSFDSVNKLGQDPLRLSNLFKIDLEGKPLERDDYDVLDSSSKVSDLVTKALTSNGVQNNIMEIANAMKAIGDNWTARFFNDYSINVAAFLATRAESEVANKMPIPIIGQIYSSENWKLLMATLEEANRDKSKSKKKNLPMLTWIAPSDSMWGKSSKLLTAIHELKNAQTTRSKQKEKLFDVQMYLPVSGSDDRFSIRRWVNEFGKDSKITKGIIEGFLGGCVEMMLYEEQFVVVLYQVIKSDLLPVTMPVGFISKDRELIRKIQSLAGDYINGMKSFEKPNDLGVLGKL